MREDAASKARRYLAEGRLVVTRCVRGSVEARVRGDGTIYTAVYERGYWACDCPAVTDQCCHLRALRLVTAPDIEARP